MKNINNQKQHYHHQISSFNCLRPPSFLEVIATNNNRRSIDDASNNIGCFAAASQLHKAKIDGWPSSPRIGCMGQIKRNNSYNGRISSSKKMFHFKKMFSSSFSSEKNTKIMTCAKVEDDACMQGISIADTMDTPLPVNLNHRSVVNVSDAANLCSNLWNRRRQGVILQNLEIEQIKLHQIQHLRSSFSSSVAVENFEAQT